MNKIIFITADGLSCMTSAPDPEPREIIRRSLQRKIKTPEDLMGFTEYEFREYRFVGKLGEFWLYREVAE